MKFALVDDLKQEALSSGERGVCICCGSETVAHCGKFNVHHWKHKTIQECDTWYEPETEWHRNWKNYFPESFQEVVKYDSKTGEKHIADIFNPLRALTIEFQHSPISHDEIVSRENFHSKLIWVVDVKPYISNIFFHKDIKSEFFEKIIMPWALNQGKLRRELSKKGDIDAEAEFLKDRSGDNYIEQFQKKYNGYSSIENYYLMEWKYQHKRWNHTKCPLFFDTGDEFVYMVIESVKIWNGFVVKRFQKKIFVDRFLGLSY
jgi:competence CoiA-like predicted nuclease